MIICLSSRRGREGLNEKRGKGKERVINFVPLLVLGEGGGKRQIFHLAFSLSSL